MFSCLCEALGNFNLDLITQKATDMRFILTLLIVIFLLKWIDFTEFFSLFYSLFVNLCGLFFLLFYLLTSFMFFYILFYRLETKFTMTDMFSIRILLSGRTQHPSTSQSTSLSGRYLQSFCWCWITCGLCTVSRRPIMSRHGTNWYRAVWGRALLSQIDCF